MKVAVIPARGGSKRIPRKNIRNFCGKPMIHWSIEVAKNSGCFDRIIVSTDDDEIASVAKRCGAEVPFIRPSAISDDHATTADVIAHSIGHMETSGFPVSAVCCIYATAPFILPQNIQEALEKFQRTNAEFVFSAALYASPIQRAFSINSKDRVEMANPEYFSTRSQDLEQMYHDAGQFYWGKPEAFVEKQPFFTSKSCAYILPRYRVCDIDTEEDWQFAEFLFHAIEKS